MASLTALTRMLTLSDEPAQAQKDTSHPHRPTLPPINTDLAAPEATTVASDDDSDSGTPLTPVFLSAYPSPASEDDAGLAPVFQLNIPARTAPGVTIDEGYSSGDTDSEPSTPRITVISPTTPLPSPSAVAGLESPWVPDMRDQPGYVSPSSSPSRKRHGEVSFESPPLGPITTPTGLIRTPRVGPFKFLRALDKGAYGTAFAARDIATNRVVCTKVFNKKRIAKKRDLLVGLLVEFVTYKQIASADEEARKWLMSMHGAVQDGQRVIFVMDLMRCDLFALLEDQIPRPTIRRWVAQIALGIDALHGMGIIHRDIKPENILLCPDGQNVRIADFTNVYQVPLPEDVDDAKPLPSLRLSWWRKYSTHYIGTVHYMAPELIEKQWYGLTVDYWALGCVLFDLLGGKSLFPQQSTMREYLKRVRAGTSTAVYLAECAPYLTEEEKHLLSGLLCIDPDLRFRLEHLEIHPYFNIDSDTENTFAFVRSLPAPSSHSMLTNAKFQFQHYNLVTAQPLCYARPEACPSFSDNDESMDEGDDRFDLFAWVNPDGIWGVRSA